MMKIHRFQPKCKHVQIIHNNNKLLYVFEMALGVVLVCHCRYHIVSQHQNVHIKLFSLPRKA